MFNIINFILNDPKGLYIFIAFVILLAVIAIGLIAKSKYESSENIKWVAEREEKV